MTAAFIGTPSYMAPEVVTDGLTGSVADVYSFGVVAIELITQRRVFGNMSAFEITSKVANEGLTPQLPEELLNKETRPNWLPSGLVELVERCVAREPNKRPTF